MSDMQEAIRRVYAACRENPPAGDYYLVLDENGRAVYPEGCDPDSARKWWDYKREAKMSEILGSEFIVEMRAGQQMSKGDAVGTLEYIDGSDIDDEAAYRMVDHPQAQLVGTCLRGGVKGRLVLVEFGQKVDTRKTVLLWTLKQRMFERWLAKKYPWHKDSIAAPVYLRGPKMAPLDIVRDYGDDPENAETP